MKVAVSGASGLIGRPLRKRLVALGHDVVAIVRKQASAGQIFWNPETGEIDVPAFNGMDAVVHLAGENVAGGRWNAARKQRILESRAQGTRLLSEALAKSPSRPPTLVCASAIGFYGDRGDEIVDEASAAGTGFLADVCVAWEGACEPAREAGIRVANLRIGVVLARDGGALAKMRLPFSLGFGGIVGTGRQYWSWVAVDDVVGSIVHCLTNNELSGPVNAVAPQSVTNAEFTRTLGRVLGRPTILPLPAFAARLALGEMADELLLASTRVAPDKLHRTGYEFVYSDLEAALRAYLSPPG